MTRLSLALQALLLTVIVTADWAEADRPLTPVVVSAIGDGMVEVRARCSEDRVYILHRGKFPAWLSPPDEHDRCRASYNRHRYYCVPKPKSEEIESACQRE